MLFLFLGDRWSRTKKGLSFSSKCRGTFLKATLGVTSIFNFLNMLTLYLLGSYWIVYFCSSNSAYRTISYCYFIIKLIILYNWTKILKENTFSPFFVLLVDWWYLSFLICFVFDILSITNEDLDHPYACHCRVFGSSSSNSHYWDCHLAWRRRWANCRQILAAVEIG